MATFRCRKVGNGQFELSVDGRVVGHASEEDLRAFCAEFKKAVDGDDGQAEATSLSSVLDLGTASVRFDRLVRASTARDGVSRLEALTAVIKTERGKELWEKKREEEIAEHRARGLFTQEKRD